MPQYPRETDEFQPVEVTLNGSPVTDPEKVSFALVFQDVRPATWTAPVVLNGRLGIRLAGLVPGVYEVWVKATDTSESPVMKAEGTIKIT